MRIYDFNIHLSFQARKDPGGTAADESTLGADDLCRCYDECAPELKAHVSSANFMLFNQDLFSGAGPRAFLDRVGRDFKDRSITALVDFRRGDVCRYIDAACGAGVDGIKFHSYVQTITDGDFPAVVAAARYAAQKGLFICIDASYGSSKMYRCDNLKLAACIADSVTAAPVILLHSGGIRVLEAMLLAAEKKNVMLETSFSLPYLVGSSVEQDFAFAYRKIGCERIIYGSDYPYVPLERSVALMRAFCEKFSFSARDVEQVMYHNAMRLKAGAYA